MPETEAQVEINRTSPDVSAAYRSGAEAFRTFLSNTKERGLILRIESTQINPRALGIVKPGGPIEKIIITGPEADHEFFATKYSYLSSLVEWVNKDIR